MIFFHRFVAVEDVLLILVFLYSLTGGQECYNSPMEEEQIKVCLKILLTLECVESLGVVLGIFPRFLQDLHGVLGCYTVLQGVLWCYTGVPKCCVTVCCKDL